MLFLKHKNLSIAYRFTSLRLYVPAPMEVEWIMEVEMMIDGAKLWGMIMDGRWKMLRFLTPTSSLLNCTPMLLC